MMKTLSNDCNSTWMVIFADMRAWLGALVTSDLLAIEGAAYLGLCMSHNKTY